MCGCPPTGQPPTEYKCSTDFAPFAKAFGQSLNVNTAILVIPVVHTILRAMNSVQLTPTKSLSSYIPLRKNVIFHKFIAGIVFDPRLAIHFRTPTPYPLLLISNMM